MFFMQMLINTSINMNQSIDLWKKYLGWLDLKIKNIWITNKSIDHANLDHTIFDKYRACGWDLPWEQQININSFKY